MKSIFSALAAASVLLLPFAAGNPTGNFNSLYLATNYQNNSAAPGATSNDAAGQEAIIGGGGADSTSQSSTCPTIFIGSAAVGGSQTTGWTSTPELVGFYVDRNLTYGTATMPVYIETQKDFSKVKRVLISQPGAPRDTWKYVNLFRNSLICAVSNASMAVTLDDVLVVAPVWLGASDRQAGAGESSDVYFGDASWSRGTNSQGPGSLAKSTFEVMDDLVSRFADQTQFPALTSIVVVGHSLGASFSQRYAMARNYNASTDALVQFWVGNPGAYVWPSSDRPVTPSNTSCAADVNDWAYGVGGQLPSYFDGSSTADIYSRYRGRTIQYALGLIDNEAGDTHCEAQYQGSSHLTRGQNMEAALKGMSGGLPASQTFNYVADVAHQDYLMMVNPVSQEYLFVDGLTQARPSGTSSATNSSSGSGGSTSGGSSSSGSGSTSSSGSSGSTSSSGSSSASSSLALTAQPLLLAIGMASCLMAVMLSA